MAQHRLLVSGKWGRQLSRAYILMHHGILRTVKKPHSSYHPLWPNVHGAVSALKMVVLVKLEVIYGKHTKRRNLSLFRDPKNMSATRMMNNCNSRMYFCFLRRASSIASFRDFPLKASC